MYEYHGLAKQDIVLVVHCANDKELSLAAVLFLAQGKALAGEIVWVTGNGAVAHMREFVA